MVWTLRVKSHFAAAHKLNGYPGECSRLHGHNWQVEATVTGNKTDNLGMLVDFKAVKGTLNEILAEFEHKYMNELPPFDAGQNPTAENLAALIFARLCNSDIFSAAVKLSAITVWEGENASVTFTPEE